MNIQKKGGTTYKLISKIIDIKGDCAAGHKLSDEIELTLFNGKNLNVGIKLCPFFLHDLFPYLCVMQFGGQFPWEENPNVFAARCPDIENTVKIRVERIQYNSKKKIGDGANL